MWRAGRPVQFTALLLTALLAATSQTVAKPRRPVSYQASPAVAAPEDPQAYAERVARQTWPGRPLCDDGGYRIRPCGERSGP
jgi:hypothetical protein